MALSPALPPNLMVMVGDGGKIQNLCCLPVACMLRHTKMRGDFGGKCPRAPRSVVTDGLLAPFCSRHFSRTRKNSISFGERFYTDGVEMFAKLSIKKAAHAIAQTTTTMTAAHAPTMNSGGKEASQYESLVSQ